MRHLSPEPDYRIVSWKNGLGVMELISIYPPESTFSDPFLFRVSVSTIRNSCSYPRYPSHEYTIILLGNVLEDNEKEKSNNNVEPLSSNNNNSNSQVNLARAISHASHTVVHNGESRGFTIKPLMPYSFSGASPTTCHMHNNLSKGSAGLVEEMPTTATTINHSAQLPVRELIILLDKKRAKMTCNVDHVSFSNPTKRKLLLGTFSLIYCVQGRISVSLLSASEEEERGKSFVISEHETLYCERLKSDTDTTEISIELMEEAPADGEECQAAFVVIDIFELPLDMLKSLGSRSLSMSAADGGPVSAGIMMSSGSPSITSPSITNGGAVPFPLTLSDLKSSPLLPAAGPADARNMVIYDDQPSWAITPADGLVSTLKNDSTNNVQSPALFASSLSVSASYEGAVEYEPPYRVLTEQISESAVPPPEGKDNLLIEDYPMGQISTAWISMMKHGLSEFIKIPVIIARGLEPGYVLGITAAVHGNELNGVPCIHRVMGELDVTKLKGTVVGIPCVNIPGYLNCTREFLDKKDLNRVFPGDENGTASQVYAYHFMNKIVYRMDYLIDLHTASFGRINSYYVRANLNDPVTAKMARLQHPQIILHNSGQDGTLRSAAAVRGIKAITVEIGNPQLFQNRYITWSYHGVMSILKSFGFLHSGVSNGVANGTVNGDGKKDPKDKPPFEPIMCSRGFWMYTRTGGVLEVYPPVNSIVRKGDLIARIKNIFGNVVDEYYAPSKGITLGRSSNPVASAGDRIIHLGVLRKEGEVLPAVAKENY